MKTVLPERVERFINSMSGNQLLSGIIKANNLKNGRDAFDVYGLWEVYGEDPNPGMGGHHHEPFLGVYEGKLIDVINYAVLLDRFYTWGGGSRIKQYLHLEVKKITASSVEDIVAARARKEALKAKIDEHKAELAWLERELGNG